MKPWERNWNADMQVSPDAQLARDKAALALVEQEAQLYPDDPSLQKDLANRRTAVGPLKPWEQKWDVESQPEPAKIPANFGVETLDTGVKGIVGKALDKMLPQGVQEFVSGMTHFPRSVMNYLGDGAGDKYIPPQGSTDSGAYVAGQLLDPTSMLVGAGGGAALSKLPLVGQLFAKGGYEAMRGKGLTEAVKAAGRNVASGAATGAGMAGVAGDDASVGALFGGALPAGMSAVGGFKNFLSGATGPMRESWRTMQANKALMETLSPETVARIEAAVQTAKPGETLGDILARENVRDASSLVSMERALRGDPRFFGAEQARQGAREEWREGMLAGTGGFAKGDEAVQAAKQGREAMTGPMRAQAFEQANVAAKTPAYLRPALEDSGLVPLTPDSVRKSLTDISQRVGNKADPTVRNVIDDLAQQIKVGMNKDGTIPAEELYTVRKQAGSIISKYAQENKDWDKRKTAGLLIQIQKGIDSAIEDATGNQGTWNRYLETYGKRSKGIDQMNVGNALLAALRGSPEGHSGSAFLAKVNQLNDDMSVLTPRQLRRVEAVSQDIRNEAMKGKMAKGGQAQQLLSVGSQGEMKVPSMLSTPATLTNYVLSKLGHGADEKITKDIGNLMFNDPAAFQKKYLTKLKPEEASAVSEALRALRYPVASTASEE